MTIKMVTLWIKPILFKIYFFRKSVILLKTKIMESAITQSLIAAIFAFVLILSGIILRKGGEPYKTSIFTLHKLAVLALIVFVVLVYIQHFKLFSFEGFGLFLFLLSGVLFAAAFFSGVLLAFEKTSSYKLQIIHRLTSWLTVLCIPVIWLCCH